jgi:heme exporter protein A
MKTDEAEGGPHTWPIEVQGLTKFFGDHQVLKGIDLKVAKGERFVIVGPNGAGKTTLVKVLATLSRPSAGRVWVHGIDIRDKPTQIRREVSLVSHESFLYDDLTVYENLRFYGKMYGVHASDERVREITSRLQLESRLHDRVGELSRGLRQRASLARAVLHDPSILLLDEPETGLDPHATGMLREMLDRLAGESHTVLVTTHNLEHGLDLSDRIVILNRGEIAYEAAKREVDRRDFLQIYEYYTRTGR